MAHILPFVKFMTNRIKGTAYFVAVLSSARTFVLGMCLCLVPSSLSVRALKALTALAFRVSGDPGAQKT